MVKGPFHQFFLRGRGRAYIRRSYTRTNICIYCNLLSLFAHNLSLSLFNGDLFRGAYIWKEFTFQSWFLNAPGRIIHGGLMHSTWGLSSEYYGMLGIQYFNSCKLFLKLQLLVNKDN